MKGRYKYGDVVRFGQRSLFCEYFPVKMKLYSDVKLGLFGKFYYYRDNIRDIHGLPNYVTKRVYERNIEGLCKK